MGAFGEVQDCAQALAPCLKIGGFVLPGLPIPVRGCECVCFLIMYYYFCECVLLPRLLHPFIDRLLSETHI